MATQLTAEERLTEAKVASTTLAGATTAEEVRQVFKGFYLKIGHKAIGRMLLGQSPEKALRLDGSRS